MFLKGVIKVIERELVKKIQAGDMNALGEVFEVYKN